MRLNIKLEYQKEIASLLLFLFLSISNCFTQTTHSKSVEENYRKVFAELTEMIHDKKELSFKRAVFITENVYLDNKLNYKDFCKTIQNYVELSELIASKNELLYNKSDKISVAKYASVFTLMTDTVVIQIDTITFKHLPLSYDFNDFAGKKYWTNMFVTKLLTNRNGNCHSLPYLYKIIIEELGEKAWLSFAPNHTFIKLKSKEFGWYNTELTSGIFPIDAWLMASGYIHLNAIQNGIYMDTLSQKQSIAACMIDLAQGYEKKLGIQDGNFILNVCDSALRYYPNYINAMLIKAETKFQLLNSQTTLTKTEFNKQKNELEKLYQQIHNLGYRKMPDEMYLQWLVSLKTEKSKYQNTKIRNYKNN